MFGVLVNYELQKLATDEAVSPKEYKVPRDMQEGQQVWIKGQSSVYKPQKQSPVVSPQTNPSPQALSQAKPSSPRIYLGKAKGVSPAEHRTTHADAAEYFEQREKERDRKRWGQMAMDYMQGKRDNMNLEDLSTVTTRKGGWKAAFNPKEMKRDAENATFLPLFGATGGIVAKNPLSSLAGAIYGSGASIVKNISRAKEWNERQGRE